MNDKEITPPEIVKTELIGAALNAVGPNRVATVAAIKSGEFVAIHLVAVPAELVDKIQKIFQLLEIECVGVVCTPDDFMPVSNKPEQQVGNA